ncbi:MAG: (S)-ureidoglycine aminohydrolase [Oscillochloridaceae bacterium umkhey_bin13]
MSELFGSTRSVLTHHYAVTTPQGLVQAPVPGWPGAACAVVISPALGARFAQLLIDLHPGAWGVRSHLDDELLVFVRAGGLEVQVGAQTAVLEAGGYAYLPPVLAYELLPREAGTQLLVFQRRYVPLADLPPPTPIFGHEQEVTATPFLGDEAAMLKLLLPDDPAFDMAVNLFTFQPGATLPMVETHVMEHGLLMLQGQGIYRLAADWHPVQAGDCIWMASFCPQWFVATGKTPARYIYYKDVNRPII